MIWAWILIKSLSIKLVTPLRFFFLIQKALGEEMCPVGGGRWWMGVSRGAILCFFFGFIRGPKSKTYFEESCALNNFLFINEIDPISPKREKNNKNAFWIIEPEGSWMCKWGFWCYHVCVEFEIIFRRNKSERGEMVREVMMENYSIGKAQREFTKREEECRDLWIECN